MASLKNLTAGQLEKMLASTKAEIRRRENIQAATAEIQAILKKYKLTMHDIDLQPSAKKIARKGPQASKPRGEARDNRKRVKAKYANPKGNETWSGRGRSPAWVVELCRQENIDLDAFKNDSRFIQG